MVVLLENIVAAYANSEEGRNLLNNADMSIAADLEKPSAHSLDTIMSYFYKAVTDKYRIAKGNAGSCRTFEIDVALENLPSTKAIIGRIQKARRALAPLQVQAALGKPSSSLPSPSVLRPAGPSASTSPPKLESSHQHEQVSYTAPLSDNLNPLISSYPQGHSVASNTPPDLASSANGPTLTEQLVAERNKSVNQQHLLNLSKSREDALQERLAEFERANTAYTQFEATAKESLNSPILEIARLNSEVSHVRGLLRAANEANSQALSDNMQLQTTLASTRGERDMLYQELEGYKVANVELRAQVGDLMTRNLGVNASAVRFREDLWHSEMRWRDTHRKGVMLQEQLQKYREINGELKRRLQKYTRPPSIAPSRDNGTSTVSDTSTTKRRGSEILELADDEDIIMLDTPPTSDLRSSSVGHHASPGPKGAHSSPSTDTPPLVQSFTTASPTTPFIGIPPDPFNVTRGSDHSLDATASSHPAASATQLISSHTLPAERINDPSPSAALSSRSLPDAIPPFPSTTLPRELQNNQPVSPNTLSSDRVGANGTASPLPPAQERLPPTVATGNTPEPYLPLEPPIASIAGADDPSTSPQALANGGGTEGSGNGDLSSVVPIVKLEARMEEDELGPVIRDMLSNVFEPAPPGTSSGSEVICLLCMKKRLASESVTRQDMDRHTNDISRLLEHVRTQHSKVFNRANTLQQ